MPVEHLTSRPRPERAADAAHAAISAEAATEHPDRELHRRILKLYEDAKALEQDIAKSEPTDFLGEFRRRGAAVSLQHVSSIAYVAACQWAPAREVTP